MRRLLSQIVRILLHSLWYQVRIKIKILSLRLLNRILAKIRLGFVSFQEENYRFVCDVKL